MLFRKQLENNSFMKFIIVSSIITIAAIIGFSYMVFLLISRAAVERQTEIQARAVESVYSYMESKYESVQAIVRNIYRSEGLSQSTAYLLEYPYQDYVRYRMDRFWSEDKTTTDSLQYFKNGMEDDPSILSLVLYSANEQMIYYFDPSRQFRIISANASRSFVPDAMYLNDSNQVSVPNVWITKSIGLEEAPMFSIRMPVTNKTSLRNSGQMLVYFRSDAVWDSLAHYKDDFKGTIMVLSANNDVLFDSSGSGYGRKFLKLAETEQENGGNPVIPGMYVTRHTHTMGGFTVVSMMPKEVVAAAYERARNMIIAVCAVCILLAVLLPSWYMTNFAKRTRRIIRFTRKVKDGDLTVRINDAKEDELGEIAKSFNGMLEDLNQYINRVYVAEIEQKHMEIAALESRVNPHFLYNTLEVIRMRAISQGAADVGEMIYSLSSLFRNYVRQKPDYRMKDELEACRLYLELFRIRYKDIFSYTLECGSALEQTGMLKLSLQPVVENYIIHGLRPERTDNRIRVTVREEAGSVYVSVEDNGRGIKQERMEQLRRELDRSEAMASFGLRSIHERLRLLYGSPYGLTVHSEENEGTTVTIVLPLINAEVPEHV